jgi:beta-glucosidase-like glycosyl hydrolase
MVAECRYFDPLESQPWAAITPEQVGSSESHRLAKEAALQGMVLLRNDRAALPLRVGKVTAVLGPLANATLALASRYYDAVCPGAMTKFPWYAASSTPPPALCLRSRCPLPATSQ